MALLADSGQATQPNPPDVPWPVLTHGQSMPIMSLSLPAFVLGLHAIQGVLASFQLPTLIQTLSKERPSGQGDRLFTLPPSVINVEDIKKFAPRKRHLKPKKLFRRLGSDFDPFWMSVDLPDDLLVTHIKQKLDTSLQDDLKTINMTALELTLLAKFGSQNGSVAVDSGSDGVTSVVLDLVQSWLVQKASCPVYYRWEDLGLLYWPRWVKRGMCSLKDTPLSKLTTESASKIPQFSPCSWPPGMHCVPDKPKRLKILRWQCRHNKAQNNFNRFRLPGVIYPQSSPTPSHRDTKKPPPAIDNQHLMENIQKQLNFSNQNFEEIQRLLNTEIKQQRGKRDSSWKSSRQSVSSAKAQENNKDKKQTEINGKKQSESDGNETENWNSVSWKQRQKALNMKCKWIKIPYPVTDNCFCSC